VSNRIDIPAAETASARVRTAKHHLEAVDRRYPGATREERQGARDEYDNARAAETLAWGA
jgi:hypothetical protein